MYFYIYLDDHVSTLKFFSYYVNMVSINIDKPIIYTYVCPCVWVCVFTTILSC